MSGSKTEIISMFPCLQATTVNTLKHKMEEIFNSTNNGESYLYRDSVLKINFRICCVTEESKVIYREIVCVCNIYVESYIHRVVYKYIHMYVCIIHSYVILHVHANICIFITKEE